MSDMDLGRFVAGVQAVGELGGLEKPKTTALQRQSRRVVDGGCLEDPRTRKW